MDKEEEVMKHFYLLYTYLNDVLSSTIKGMIDGASFFSFFKRGGLHNMIHCFSWLGNVLP